MVRTSLSVRKVLGWILGQVKSDARRQRFLLLRRFFGVASCVAKALSRGDRSQHSSQAWRNAASIMKAKSNLHDTRGVTPKRVTSGGAQLRGLAPGQHSSKEMSQRWRAVSDTVPI